MSKDPHRIVVPRLGVNEDVVTLVAWLVEDGDAVQVGQLIAQVETSKAVSDLHADVSGYVRIRVQAGNEVPIRAEIGAIVADADAPLPSVRPQIEREAQPWRGPEETKGEGSRRARRAAQGLGLDPDATIDGVLADARLRQAPPLAIYGAGAGGQVIAEMVRQSGTYRPVVFLDDGAGLPPTVMGIEVRNGEALTGLGDEGIETVFCAVGRGVIREQISARIGAAGLRLATVRHPSAVVSPSARVGEGVLIKAGAIVGPRCTLMEGAYVDNGAVVSHDTCVGPYSLVGPGASLGSAIEIGARVVIGIGASVATGVHIDEDAVVATGAAVVRDVTAGSVVEGSPARVVGHTRG